MKLLRKAQVLVIDNEKAEAKPILAALNRSDIPVLFYSGRVEELPSDPMTGVRLLFLDIELEGMGGKSDKDKASSLCGVVSKLIDLRKNGPLSIVFWTKHVEIATSVVESLTKNYSCHISHAEMDKNDFKANEANFDFNKVREALDKEVKKQKMIDLYAMWEDAVSDAAAAMSARVAMPIPCGEDWDKALSYSVFLMCRAVREKNVPADAKEQFLSACRVLCAGLKTEILNRILKIEIPKDMKFINNLTGELEEKLSASVNSLTHLDVSVSPDLQNSGSCYVIDAPSERELRVLSALVGKYFGEGSVQCLVKNSPVKLCMVVITPRCDVAQNKTLRIDSAYMQRVVYGVVFSCEQSFKYSKTERDYIIDKIFVENKALKFVFDFATVCGLFSDELPKSGLCIFSEEVVFDIQSKAANQVNRLGSLKV